jgi:hypothetical protein
MKRSKMLEGTVIGRLTVLERFSIGGKAQCLCLCSCGRHTKAFEYNLQSGHTNSCGCLGVENSAKAKIKHGQACAGRVTPEFRAWQSMINRCYNKSSRDYPSYGYRGITVADEWRESFVTFNNDMGPKPSPFHSLDRIDNDGLYCQENCRWATKKEQALNKGIYGRSDEAKKLLAKERIERAIASKIKIRRPLKLR